MKKQVLSIILCLLSVSAFSQIGDLENQTYIRAGLSLPTWKYYGFESKTDWADDVHRIGGIFEFGNIFMINSLKLSPGMRVGINVDYISLSYHGLKISDSDWRWNFIYFGSKIGPSFSYSPFQRLVFDVAFKFNPVWVSTNIETTESYTNVTETETNVYLGFLGLKYSIGFNVRYSILMAGFEINPGFAKLRWFDDEENKLSDDIYLGNDNNNNDKTPIPGINFTLGLSL